MHLLEEHVNECIDIVQGTRIRNLTGGQSTAIPPRGLQFAQSMSSIWRAGTRRTSPTVDNPLLGMPRSSRSEQLLRRRTTMSESERRQAYDIFVSTHFEVLSLPKDILCRIINYLPLRDQIRCARVCKMFHIAAVEVTKACRDVDAYLQKREQKRQEILQRHLESQVDRTSQSNISADGTTEPQRTMEQTSSDTNQYINSQPTQWTSVNRNDYEEMTRNQAQPEPRQVQGPVEVPRSTNGPVVVQSQPPAVVLTIENGIPIPVCDNLADIGWMGNISRGESERCLESQAQGIFLLRWSTNTRSYVLSYKSRHQVVNHISGICPQPDGTVQVDKENGSRTIFENINMYLIKMRHMGVITMPYVDPINTIVYHNLIPFTE